MNKKGLVITYTWIIIIAVLILLILIPFIFKIGQQTASASRLAQCKQSVISNAALRQGALDFSDNVKCPTKRVIIDSKDQTVIKQKIAYEMAECWNIFEEGKKELFSGDGMFCAVCSRMEFENKDLQVKGFSKFLATSKMPNSDKTYLEYLTPFNTEDAERVVGKFYSSEYDENAEAFSTNTDYATIFVYAKGKNSMEKLKNFLTAETTAGKVGYVVAAGTGATVGLIVGFAVSGPVGWVAGILTAGAALITTYWADPGNVPEWAAITVFTEYSPNVRLKDTIGCEYFPVEQE